MVEYRSTSWGPKFTILSDDILNDMRTSYRRIRKDVYEKGTAPTKYTAHEHAKNQQILRAGIVNICDQANLEKYFQPGVETQQKIWNSLWRKIIYSGFKARTANLIINSIKDTFDNYGIFTTSDWDYHFFREIKRDKDGRELLSENGKIQKIKKIQPYSCGIALRNYLLRRDIFDGKHTNRKQDKIVKIIEVAREFSEFFSRRPNAPGIEFILRNPGQFGDFDIWNINRNFQSTTSYKGDITVLHLMADLGFETIKPDKVLARAFFELGWLERALILPRGISLSDIVPISSNENRHSNLKHYAYTNQNILVPIVELSRQIIGGIDRDALKDDIGWHTSNNLREFDFFMCKYGQDKEEIEFGIQRNLSSTRPYSEFRTLPTMP